MHMPSCPAHTEASAVVSECPKLMRFAHPRLGHNLESMHFTAFSIQLAFYVILLGFDLGKHNILEHELE